MLFAFGPEPERRVDDEFREFWQRYPRRVAPLAAQKAFAKARKLASLADILEGVERYKRTKPAYADWCHASTWLNQGRWMDQPDVPQQLIRTEWICPHDPRCPHRFHCEKVLPMKQRLARGDG